MRVWAVVPDVGVCELGQRKRVLRTRRRDLREPNGFPHLRLIDERESHREAKVHATHEELGRDERRSRPIRPVQELLDGIQFLGVCADFCGRRAKPPKQVVE